MFATANQQTQSIRHAECWPTRRLRTTRSHVRPPSSNDFVIPSPSGLLALDDCSPGAGVLRLTTRDVCVPLYNATQDWGWRDEKDLLSDLKE
ncbi:hypothetical protein ElyMa_003193100 [Elysia marginata]|uniref:Uncharacterized protein n=1 Tax=Elysia marginata TaxID=1093978 RepID=A0AAV4IYZ1_9GAST|nr:hypothetical protein ElyMa_003193100 [Elysia marginata]